MALGVFNQVWWPGVGDADECWIIATYWAVVATGAVRRQDLPSIRKFRAAAGRPDRPGSSGGNNGNIVTALRKLDVFNNIDVVKYDGGRDGFTRLLKKGYIASLSVWSGALPKAYQFGFKGAHQISVYYQNGGYYVMNPLAKEGSALMRINYNSLVFAANALGGKGWSKNPLMHAVFVRAKESTPPPPPPKGVSEPGGKGRRPAPTIIGSYLDPHGGMLNYLDPWAAQTFYDRRHSRRSVDGLKRKR